MTQFLDNRLPEFSEMDGVVTQGTKSEAAEIPELATLQQLLEKEADALLDGAFDTFERLQPQKRAAIRSVERLTRRPGALEHLSAKQQKEFNEATARNEKIMRATTEAIKTIRAHALGVIEQNNGDGVYDSAGSTCSSKRLSSKGVTVKL